MTQYDIKLTYLPAAGYSAGSANLQQTTLSLIPRVVLLLHDMSGSASAWSHFLADIGGTAPKITKGVLAKTATPIGGVFYYAVSFGSYDNGGRTGLESVKASSPASGDFSTFENLSEEVRDAITGILLRHPTAQVVLVGHGRGGLAARAFLQKSATSDAKSAVVGLLTLGTPNLGSPLGLLYGYLKAHPRTTPSTTDQLTWALVNSVLQSDSWDLRRPTFEDLGTDSSPISQLNSNVSKLPTTGVKYRNYVYGGKPFGTLANGVNLFSTTGPHVSGLAEQTMLGVGKLPSASEFDGDGVVPKASQAMNNSSLSSKLPLDIDIQTTSSSGILHADEPEQTSDISTGISTLVPW